VQRLPKVPNSPLRCGIRPPFRGQGGAGMAAFGVDDGLRSATETLGTLSAPW
jgi:hypothetical protein